MRPALIIYPILWLVAIVFAALGALTETWGVVIFAILLGAISGVGMVCEFGYAMNQRK